MNSNKLVLKSLSLNNFATFDNQEIEFNNSFNTIVGETGSGKSLILDALQLVFGNRADKKIIRKGSKFSTVEAVFICSCPIIQKYFENIGHPYENNEIIIKRVINQEGSSKAYLNFQQCSLTTLTSISKRYIDLVGQFDNQKLLSEDYQLKLVDDFAKINLSKYSTSFDKLKNLEQELEDAINESKTNSQRKDYLEFQIRELNELCPSPEDEDQLISKKEELLDIQKKSQSYQEVTNLLSDQSNSILSQLNTLISTVDRNDLLPNQENENLIEAKESLEEISFFISKKSQNTNDDSEVQEIVEKLDSYQKVKRKFNCSTTELVEIFESFKDEFSRIENSDQRIEQLKEEINAAKEFCWNEASKINTKRAKSVNSLSKDLTNKVRGLRMNGATIKIELSELDTLNKNGASSISFMAQTNTGEGFYKVKDIASGGELSRILLALRQILSQGDTISVFLFDEIDTGIGGETAVSIGKALDEVSKTSQVIAITHLPQIAKFSNHLIDVNKKSISSRTFSYTTIISNNKRDDYLRAMAQL